MKSNYTITSAKEKLIRCGMRFEGKKILGRPPGIGGWGAVDFLRSRGYSLFSDPIKEVKTVGDLILRAILGKTR